MTIIKKRGIWNIVWRERGRQRWKSLKTKDKVAAMSRFALFRKEWEDERAGMPSRPKDVIWDVFCEEYNAAANANKAAGTIERDLSALRVFDRCCPVHRLSEVTPQLLEKFKLMRKEAGILPGTFNRDLSMIKTMMKKAAEWGYATPNVWGVRKMSEVRKHPRFFLLEEMARLLAAADPFMTTLLLLGFHTGLRRGEMLRLDWSDIDWQRKLVKVAIKDDWVPKDREARDVPMNAELEEHLRRWRAVCRGSRVMPWEREPKDLSAAFTKFLKRCDVLGATLHTLRHSFASHLVINGVDIIVVSKLMGHNSIQTTMIYAHLLPSCLDKAVAKLPTLCVVVSTLR